MSKIDVSTLGAAMLGAARKPLAAHWTHARSFAESEMHKLALTAAQIEVGYRAHELTEQQAQILLQMQANASQSVLTALEGIGMIAAQDAINAALDVLRGAVNAAVGVALL